jgi:hypothetical protein
MIDDHSSMPCFECGNPADHEHHVIPRVLGGTKTVPLCEKCHGLIHDRHFVHHRELTKKGLVQAKERGRIGGRREKLNAQQRAEIKSLIKRGWFKQVDCARQARVHPATICRMMKADIPPLRQMDLWEQIAVVIEQPARVESPTTLQLPLFR